MHFLDVWSEITFPMSQEHGSEFIKSIMFMLLQHFHWFKPTMFLRWHFQSEAMERSRGRCHVIFKGNENKAARDKHSLFHASIQLKVSQEHLYKKCWLTQNNHIGIHKKKYK